MTELLVVIGIIALLGTLTVVSFRAVAADAKLSSGKNTVMTVLDHARGLAMKRNKIVMVVFRPKLDGSQQYLEAVFVEHKATGRACLPPFPGSQQTEWCPVCTTGTTRCPRVVDQFAPVPNVAARRLPSGIKVASPGYGAEADDLWFTPSHFPAMTQSTSIEIPGRMIAVMYGADGSVITRNSATDSERSWVDFDNDGFQTIGGGTPINYNNFPPADLEWDPWNGLYFEQYLEKEEPFVDIAVFLAVFDDDEVRRLYNPERWKTADANAAQNRLDDYGDYLTRHADRIHFNRYTGVVMK
ncbi:MAG: hypothetical protein L0Y44_15670 [Phycisphaerales bacterium]|nr:hypothetical protein [Phycisphaerales bacterium]MCI0632084.1 hypothetical protein [Phycisphaerales bacterium]MCI0677004.1 hypothetical protein [Phycisphaerales bacterium]